MKNSVIILLRKIKTMIRTGSEEEIAAVSISAGEGGGRIDVGRRMPSLLTSAGDWGGRRMPGAVPAIALGTAVTGRKNVLETATGAGVPGGRTVTMVDSRAAAADEEGRRGRASTPRPNISCSTASSSASSSSSYSSSSSSSSSSSYSSSPSPPALAGMRERGGRPRVGRCGATGRTGRTGGIIPRGRIATGPVAKARGEDRPARG